MGITLSIKNAPSDVVRRLRRRAKNHRRSLQGELLTIIEEAVSTPRAMTPAQVLAAVGKAKLRTPAESVSMVRAGRNARKGR